MLIWCGILFTLGILAFMDSLFNYGDIFRQVNSVLFMLVSLGLLIRTTTKIRTRSMEKYLERINTLEEQVFALQQTNEKGREPNRRMSVPA
jgi:predicted membrane-bound mannosyltransferase